MFSLILNYKVASSCMPYTTSYNKNLNSLQKEGYMSYIITLKRSLNFNDSSLLTMLLYAFVYNDALIFLNFVLCSLAWLIGWSLMLEYTIGGSAIARGISPNLVLCVNFFPFCFSFPYDCLVGGTILCT